MPGVTLYHTLPESRDGSGERTTVVVVALHRVRLGLSTHPSGLSPTESLRDSLEGGFQQMPQPGKAGMRRQLPQRGNRVGDGSQKVGETPTNDIVSVRLGTVTGTRVLPHVRLSIRRHGDSFNSCGGGIASVSIVRGERHVLRSDSNRKIGVKPENV